LLVATGGEWKENALFGVSQLEIESQRNVGAIDVVITPLTEKFGGKCEIGGIVLFTNDCKQDKS